MFFFFQAEDGIRDKLVTGVQTCALPILGRQHPRTQGARAAAGDRLADWRTAARAPTDEHEDRKSVVEGKRGDLGGRRIIKKKKKNKKANRNNRMSIDKHNSYITRRSISA